MTNLAGPSAPLVGGAINHAPTLLALVVLSGIVLGLIRLSLVIGLIHLGTRASTTDPVHAEQTIRAMVVLTRGLEAVTHRKFGRRDPPAD